VAELTEVVAEAAEGVASEALNVAAVSRGLSSRDLAIGFAVGAAVGAGIAFLWTRRKLETKYEKQAEEEIDAMREHFRSRLVAREEKPDLGQLAEQTKELGYSTPGGPRPVSPEADPTAIETPVLKPPVPVAPREPNRIHEALEEAQDRDPLTQDYPDGWNWDEEKANRTPRIPYVIHVDERGEADFDSLTYTYYEGDDVVCDDGNNIITARDEIVGNHNLARFGHGGTQDPNVVYVRNENLALEIELVRDPGTYTEEVQGIQHADGGVERRRRQTYEEN
jgi:hypothetical protein